MEENKKKLKFYKELLEEKVAEYEAEAILKDLKKNKDKVYYLREIVGLTQKATAEKLAISEQRVYQIEREYKKEKR